MSKFTNNVLKKIIAYSILIAAIATVYAQEQPSEVECEGLIFKYGEINTVKEVKQVAGKLQESIVHDDPESPRFKAALYQLQEELPLLIQCLKNDDE